MTRKKRNHNHASRGERNDITLMGTSKVILPADGTAIEVKLPECIEYFISEDGKLMFQKKQQEPANAPENFDITYDEIADKLFLGNEAYTNIGFGKVKKYFIPNIHHFAIQEGNCKTKAQVLKNLAFNKLINIANYLNDGWRPNFGEFLDSVYCIGRNKDGKVIPITCYAYNTGQVVFPSSYICKQAIRIMGEKSIHDLLNTEY